MCAPVVASAGPGRELDRAAEPERVDLHVDAPALEEEDAGGGIDRQIEAVDLTREAGQAALVERQRPAERLRHEHRQHELAADRHVRRRLELDPHVLEERARHVVERQLGRALRELERVELQARAVDDAEVEREHRAAEDVGELQVRVDVGTRRLHRVADLALHVALDVEAEQPRRAGDLAEVEVEVHAGVGGQVERRLAEQRHVDRRALCVELDARGLARADRDDARAARAHERELLAAREDDVEAAESSARVVPGAVMKRDDSADEAALEPERLARLLGVRRAARQSATSGGDRSAAEAVGAKAAAARQRRRQGWMLCGHVAWRRGCRRPLTPRSRAGSAAVRGEAQPARLVGGRRVRSPTRIRVRRAAGVSVTASSGARHLRFVRAERAV